MDRDFRGEQVGLALAFSGHEHKVKYLSDAERPQHEVHVANGLLCTPDGKPFQSIGSEGSIYVRSPSGTLYVTNDYKTGEFHHSSFLAGQPVVDTAGHIWIEAGKAVKINNKSGHYQSEPVSMVQTLLRLKMEGLDVSRVKIEIEDDYSFKPRYGFQMEMQIARAVELMSKLRTTQTAHQLAALILDDWNIFARNSALLQEALGEDFARQIRSGDPETKTKFTSILRELMSTAPDEPLLARTFQQMELMGPGSLSESARLLEGVGWNNTNIDAWLEATDRLANQRNTGPEILNQLASEELALFRAKIKPALKEAHYRPTPLLASALDH